jgi:predicted transposase/invertase (TIGR01784 family)
MPFRMIDYRLRVYRRFPHKRMRQVLIYLKQTSSELVQQNTFAIPGTCHEFEVIRLWEQPTEILLQYAGLLPLAVLGATDDRSRILRQVAQEIEAVNDRRQQSNVAAATSILASLVLDQRLIQRILRQDVMKESVIYQEIKAEGRAEGLQQGIEEGIRRVAMNLLKSGMPVEEVVKMTGLSVEQVHSLQQETE